MSVLSSGSFDETSTVYLVRMRAIIHVPCAMKCYEMQSNKLPMADSAETDGQAGFRLATPVTTELHLTSRRSWSLSERDCYCWFSAIFNRRTQSSRLFERYGRAEEENRAFVLLFSATGLLLLRKAWPCVVPVL